MQTKIKQTLFYPCITSIIAFTMLICMFIFIIPRFAELFHDMRGQLPYITIFLFYLSTKISQHCLLLFGLSICIIMALIKSPFTLKRFLHQSLISLPPIKHFLNNITLIRFARNLSITFAAGIPITDALTLTANISNNQEFVAILSQLRSKISAGVQLHLAMSSIPFFPLLMTQMVKIGEESGMLDHMLDKCADMLEADINQLINKLNQLAEPLIMVILGVLIGGLVIGMYLPIFKLGSAL